MASTSCSVRAGTAADLEAIAGIQAASPGAAQWPVSDYLAQDLRVAEAGGRVLGFLAARTLAAGESEVLNLAVAPDFRRLGVGRALLDDWIAAHPGTLWLEVRESNSGARTFYQAIGFTVVGRREDYYTDSPEAAIVLKFHSC